MQVYTFDGEGVFVGTSETEESPLEKGVIIYPKNSTKKKPPNVGAYEKAVFYEDNWHVLSK